MDTKLLNKDGTPYGGITENNDDSEFMGAQAPVPAADKQEEPEENTIGIVDSGVEFDATEDDSEEGENTTLSDGIIQGVAGETAFTKEQERAFGSRADTEAERLSRSEETGYQEFEDDLEARGVSLAGRQARRALYHETYIRPIGQRTEFETPAQKMLKTRSKYALAARSYHDGYGQVLEGEIRAALDRTYTVRRNGEVQKVRIPSVMIVDGPVAVFIPMTYLTRLRTNVSGTADERRRALMGLANARIGSRIKYVVMSFNEKNQTAIGNRLAVLDSDRQTYYTRRSRRTGDYLLHEGDLAEARVTYLTANHIGIEVFGEEASLGIPDVTHSRTRDLWRYFEKKYGTSDIVGRTFPVRITSLVRTETAKTDADGKTRRETTASVRFSMKDALGDERRAFARHLVRDAKWQGEVTTVNEYGIFVNLDGSTEVDALCSVENNMRIPNVGDRVLVRISGVEITNDDVHVTGYIRRIF